MVELRSLSAVRAFVKLMLNLFDRFVADFSASYMFFYSKQLFCFKLLICMINNFKIFMYFYVDKIEITIMMYTSVNVKYSTVMYTSIGCILTLSRQIFC